MEEDYDSSVKARGGEPEGILPETAAGTYIRVWAGIIFLTALSLTLSRIGAGGGMVVLSLLIAGAQSALALYFFMHLRQERARVFKVLIPLVLGVLVIFMALTFSDVAFRG
jgi:cytochrome c oxidase subunit IV